MTRRLAIHTLVAVGLSFAMSGCKTIKSKLGLSGKSKPEHVEQNPLEQQDFPPVPSGQKPPVTKPVTVIGGQGKVALVDKELRFVVVDFAYSQLPSADQRYYVYRDGHQVGEVITTGQIDDTFLVADINKGDIRTGDLIRPE